MCYHYVIYKYIIYQSFICCHFIAIFFVLCYLYIFVILIPEETCSKVTGFMIIKEVNSLRCLRVFWGCFFFVKWLWWKCWNFLGEVKCSPPRLLLRIIKRFEILINIWYCLNLTLNHLIKINRLIGAPLIKSLRFIRGKHYLWSNKPSYSLKERS